MSISNLPALTKPTLLPQGSGQFFRQRLAELFGLLLLAVGIAGLLALVSFDRGDPSYNLATPQAPANLLGRPGAYTADLLLQTIGLAGYVLAGVLAVWGLLFMRRHGVKRLALRFALLPLVLLLWALALSHLPADSTAWIAHAGPGGITGRELAQVAHLYGDRFGLGGSSIAALCALAAALTTIPTLAMRGRDWPWLLRLISRFIGGLARGLWRALRFMSGAVDGWRVKRAKLASEFNEPAMGYGERVEPTLARALGDGPQGGQLAYAGDPLDQADDDRRYADDPAGPEIIEAEPGSVDYIQPDPVQVLERQPAASDVRPLPISINTPREIVLARAPAPQVGRRAARQSQLDLRLDKFALPQLDNLAVPPKSAANLFIDEEALAQNARLLESVLAEFGVKGEIVKVRPGPVVTLYELEPAPGTKSSRVINLADDIARSMSSVSVRVATVPGRNVIGIELPNQRRETVYLRELLASKDYEDERLALPLVLGKDIGGSPVVADLARMPHLLIGGTTGSGKSVAINTMILSLLYRLTPDKCRFIMIDPKMLELSVYADIPHLLTPVVTEPRKAVVALKWVVREMENRYRVLSQLGVRNIAGYNERVAEAKRKGELITRTVQTGTDPQTGRPTFEEQPLELEALPFIVVIVDEMADLMLVAGKDIEAAIQRLAQMARAAGIHIIMATQRPSVDVITGTIKANFPTRISFQVTSKIDSRTILGEQGGEQLLGQGDMLYMAGGGRISRVHGPFVTDVEVEKVVKFLRSQGDPLYLTGITEEQPGMAGGAGGFDGGEGNGGEGSDDLYDQAVAIITRERKASTSFIQRHLQIGYNRAARIIERMEAEGVVSAANHVGKREVLARDIEDNERVN